MPYATHIRSKVNKQIISLYLILVILATLLPSNRQSGVIVATLLTLHPSPLILDHSDLTSFVIIQMLIEP